MTFMMTVAAKSGLAAGSADHIVRSNARGKCGNFVAFDGPAAISAALWPRTAAGDTLET